MHSSLLFCLFVGAFATLELNELSSALYAPTRARTPVRWTHKSLGAPSSPLRIALATPELRKNSETEQILLSLIQRGHQVHVFTTERSSHTFEFPVQAVSVSSQKVGNKGRAYARSQAVYQALSAAPHFDIVVFEDSLGLVSMQAKQAGLSLERTALALRLDTLAVRSLDSIQAVVASFMARESVKLADVLVTSNSAVLSTLAAAGFKVPETPVYEVSAVSWVSFLEFVPTQVRAPAAVTEEPKVSVIVTTYNRPEFLRQSVASIEAQTYSNVEIVVVDDGSTDTRVATELTELEARGVKVVRQANKYLGAARNAGVAAATGDLILFLDDDNIAFPAMVSTLVRSIQVSGADVAVNAHSIWTVGEPKSSSLVWTPLGPAPLAGLLENVLGNANFMVRKSAFARLGGFTTDRTGLEDYEFHAAAVLANTPYVVVPRSLMYYRIHDRQEQMAFETAGIEANERAMRPYTHLLQKTGHSTRDVHEHKRLAAASCTVTKVIRTACEANPTFIITVEATQRTDAPYADSDPNYHVGLAFQSSADGATPVEHNNAGTVGSSSHTAGTSSDIITVTGTANDWAAVATNDAINPSVEITLNVGLTNGYTSTEITCSGAAPEFVVNPDCLCSNSAFNNLCDCTGASGRCFPLDFDTNGERRSPDLAVLLAVWGCLPLVPNPIADVNADGQVDVAELAQLLFFWTEELRGRSFSP